MTQMKDTTRLMQERIDELEAERDALKDDLDLTQTANRLHYEHWREEQGRVAVLEARLTRIADETRDHPGLGLIHHYAIGTHDAVLAGEDAET